MSFRTDISPRRTIGCRFILLVCTAIVSWVRKFGEASMPEILVKCECEAALLPAFVLREVALPTAFKKTKENNLCDQQREKE